MQITPLMREALVACAHSIDGKLRRTRGGYVATGSAVPIFTKRLVRSLHNAWLLQLHGEYDESAALTSKGASVVAEILPPRSNASRKVAA